MPLMEQFNEATVRVQALPPASPEVLLKLYGLYKQSTIGDVPGDRPGMLEMRARAKFDAWASRRGMNVEEAQEEYIEYVDELLGE